MARTSGTWASAVALAILFAACAPKEDPADPPPPVPVRLTLAPDSTTIYAGQSIQFVATVRDAANKAVEWSLSGSGCSGDSCGTLSSTGLYTAPRDIPGPTLTVTVRAVAVADRTKTASATITIMTLVVELALAPDTVHIYAGETVKFEAIIRNATDDTVDWSLVGAGCGGASCGTIDPSGLYTAPAAVPDPPVISVEARLFVDPAKSAQASVTVLEPVTDRWAWMSGSKEANQPGVLGVRGVPSALNIPVARDPAASWVDGSGKLWLFGGSCSAPYIQGIYNDLWSYEPATRQWTWVSGSDYVDQGSSYGMQGVPAPDNVPGARISTAAWVDGSDGLWLFGGFGYGLDHLTAGELSDLWRYDPASGMWTWIAGNRGNYWTGSYGSQGVADPANKPGGRYGAVTWTDAAGRLWLFGGRGNGSSSRYGYLNDLWCFDTGMLQWTWVSGSETVDQGGDYGALGTPAPANVPGGRHHALSWIDGAGRLWLFGGFGYDVLGLSGDLNDLWYFDTGTLQWTWVSGSDQRERPGLYGTLGVPDPANVPGSRYSAVAWADPAGRFWIMGGFGRDSRGFNWYLNDLWRFDPASGVWTWMSGSDMGPQDGVYGTKGMAEPGNVPGSRIGAASWADARGCLWLFGGTGNAEIGAGGQLSDLWKYLR